MFAAGNEGFHVSATDDGLKTVTSPATSKNCIAAGATNTANQQSASITSSQQYTVARMAVLQAVGGGAQVVDNYRVSLKRANSIIALRHVASMPAAQPPAQLR